MRTLIRSFALFALFALVAALVAAAGVSSAPALQKEKDKEEVGTVEVFKGKDGWRFRVKNAEGKSIAGGYVPHEKKEDCLKEVEFLKTTFAKGKVVEIKEEKKDKDK